MHPDDYMKEKIPVDEPRTLRGKSAQEMAASLRQSPPPIAKPGGASLDINQKPSEYNVPQPEFITREAYYKRIGLPVAGVPVTAPRAKRRKK